MADTQMGMPESQDPSAQGTMSPEQSDSFVVCIAVQSDGTFSVYSQDSDADPAAEGDDGSGGMQTADNIDDALMMVKQMVEQEMGEGESESAEDGNAPLQGGDAKAVWDQMAAKKDKSRMMEQ